MDHQSKSPSPTYDSNLCPYDVLEYIGMESESCEDLADSITFVKTNGVLVSRWDVLEGFYVTMQENALRFENGRPLERGHVIGIDCLLFEGSRNWDAVETMSNEPVSVAFVHRDHFPLWRDFRNAQLVQRVPILRECTDPGNYRPSWESFKAGEVVPDSEDLVTILEGRVQGDRLLLPGHVHFPSSGDIRAITDGCLARISKNELETDQSLEKYVSSILADLECERETRSISDPGTWINGYPQEEEEKSTTPILGLGRNIVNGYHLERELGSGSYGKVYLCRKESKETNCSKLYAMKIISRAQGFESLLREAKAFRSLNHPNLVTIHEFIDDQCSIHIYIISEFVEGGHLKCTPPLLMPRIVNVLKDVVRGLLYIHSRGVVHGDIKPQNLLLDREGNVKICDFGSAVFDRLATQPSIGTPAFMSPELHRGKPPTPESDVWALGITLYQMAHGHLPFQRDQKRTILDALESDSVKFSLDSTLAYVTKIHYEDLVTRMLHCNPDHRIPLVFVSGHKFMHEINIPSTSRP